MEDNFADKYSKYRRIICFLLPTLQKFDKYFPAEKCERIFVKI